MINYLEAEFIIVFKLQTKLIFDRIDYLLALKVENLSTHISSHFFTQFLFYDFYIVQAHNIHIPLYKYIPW